MFRHIDHRPYPVPRRAWIMGMRWHDLLFAHWPVPVELLRRHVPAGLELDLFHGQAWVGIVPFRMTGVRPRGCPSLPWFSAFPELNVRTYVTADGKPGVWFMSLDATNPLAVRAARWSYCLPYFDARLRLTETAGEISYSSRRTHRDAPPAEFTARYKPVAAVYASQPGDLDHWLTERYCLYSADRRGRIFRGEIHHAPWPLQPAAAEIQTNTMAQPFGIDLAGPPLLHFARFLDVAVWGLERAALAPAPALPAAH